MLHSRSWFNQERSCVLQIFLDILLDMPADQPINLPAMWHRLVIQEAESGSDLYGLNLDTAREALKQLGLLRNKGGKGSAARWVLERPFSVHQAILYHFNQPHLPLDMGSAGIIADQAERIDHLERALRNIARRGDELGQLARQALETPVKPS